MERKRLLRGEYKSKRQALAVNGISMQLGPPSIVFLSSAYLQ